MKISQKYQQAIEAIKKEKILKLKAINTPEKLTFSERNLLNMIEKKERLKAKKR